MAALSGVSAAVDTSTSQALRRSSKGNKQTIGKSSGTKQAVKGKVVAGGMKKLEGKPPKKAMVPFGLAKALTSRQ